MRIRSLLPSYAVRRIAQWRFTRRMPDAPWITRSSVLLLHEWLKPGDRGIEWGSGRSTIWFARRVAFLFSVEHVPQWHSRVAADLHRTHLAGKVDYRLVDCELGSDDEPDAHPYADVVNELDDSGFDFVLVDGRIRLPCIRLGMQKLKPGGLLILDNANRYIPNRFGEGHTTVCLSRDAPLSDGWRGVCDELADWRWINTSDGICDTRMWIKPS